MIVILLMVYLNSKVHNSLKSQRFHHALLPCHEYITKSVHFEEFE